MRGIDIKFGTTGAEAALGDRDTFLREAMKGDYRYGSEDRLSQIFSASFNHSKLFRKAVSEFFECRPLQRAVSRTQQFYETRHGAAKLDIIIQTEHGSPLLAIENKVDSSFGVNQLRNYSCIDELNGCRKYCLLKHYIVETDAHQAWRLHYWGSFYLHLLRRSEQDFFSENFLATLKDYKMDNPIKIKKADLKRLAKSMHELRYTKKLQFSCNAPVFETLVDIKKMLAELFSKVVASPTLRKRAGKSFRPNMYTSWWYDNDPKSPMLWVGCDTRLKKTYKGITGFAAALILYEKGKPERYDLVAYVTETDEEWRDDMKTYRKTDVGCGEFADMAIKYWEKVLR